MLQQFWKSPRLGWILWIHDLSEGIRTCDLGHGMYRVCIGLGTLMRELSRYKSDLVGVQEVRWEASCTEPSGEYIFSYGKRNENHELGTFSCT
jgi:hypothetical protein